MADDLLRRILALLSVVVFVFLIAAGLLGTQEDPLANILPAFVWIAWWVGLGFVCALVGNVWPALNPWAAVPALVPGVLRGHGRPLASWVGVWPAVFLYLCFAWTELVWPDNTAPASLASAILIYSAITWAGMARYGIEPWLRCGETFSVVFELFGRFAPLAAFGSSGSPSWRCEKENVTKKKGPLFPRDPFPCPHRVGCASPWLTRRWTRWSSRHRLPLERGPCGLPPWRGAVPKPR